MRWLRGNIGVDGSDYLKGLFRLDWLPSAEAKRNMATYESSIELLLGKLSGPATGYWVLKDIGGVSSKKVVIKPWHHDSSKDPKTETKYMAYGEPKSYADATPAGEFAKTSEQSELKSAAQKKENIGTGYGTDHTIYFSPWFTGESRPKGPGFGADETLLHELVHALNSLKGNLRMTGGAPDGFDGQEEFTAVLITNLYSSQTGGDLRADHNGHTSMPQKLRDPKAFYDRYPDAVQDCYRFHLSLTSIYKGWDAGFVPFNPFRYCT